MTTDILKDISWTLETDEQSGETEFSGNRYTVYADFELNVTPHRNGNGVGMDWTDYEARLADIHFTGIYDSEEDVDIFLTKTDRNELKRMMLKETEVTYNGEPHTTTKYLML